MSRRSEKASGQGQGEPDTASVYDFLYHDARRVGSFLAQFHASGLLQGIKEIDGAVSAKQSKAGGLAGGGVPGIARTQGHFEDQSSSESREGAERTYDPLWQNALALLDFLNERNLIKRSLNTARIGQFVLVTGGLSILDAALMQAAWPLQTVQKAVRAGAGKQPAQPKGMPNPTDLALDLLKILPHPAQAMVTGEGVLCWCSLARENLITATGDLLLKHGRAIVGQWSVLGVLDAMPEDEAAQLMAQMEAEAAAATTPQARIVANIVEALAPMMRTLLGRPPQAHGVTPILIFREIGA